MNVDYYYSKLVETHVEIIDGVNHTMQHDDFIRYVTQTKFSTEQKELLKITLSAKNDIIIFGAYENNINYLLNKYSASIISIKERLPRRTKLFNRKRPLFCHIRLIENNIEQLWIIVFPSKEYVNQIGELIASFGYLYFKIELNIPPDIEYLQKIKIVHFPILEQNLTTWTEIDATLIQNIKVNDCVILGHVEEIAEKLLKERNFEEITEPIIFGIDNIYTLYKLRNKKTRNRVILLGFVHSYWGTASGSIASSLVKCNIKTLFYIAKAGNLISPEKISASVSPDLYYLLDRENAFDHWALSAYKVPNWPDTYAYFGKIERTGIHLTVPTVIGETLKQAQTYSNSNPSTIDNEIGHIAKAIHEYNISDKVSHITNFICIHFITDFLHRDYDTRKATKGLGESYKQLEDIQEVRQKMSEFLSEACIILDLYITLFGLQDTSVPEDRFEKQNREILIRMAMGIESLSILTNEDLTPTRFAKGKSSLEKGNFKNAVDIIFGNNDFRQLPCADKLESIIIKQKYGLLDTARSELNVAIQMHQNEFSDFEKIDYNVVDIKLRCQVGNYIDVENDCLNLIPKALGLKMYSKIPSLYHKAAYAAHFQKRVSDVANYLNESQKISKDRNRHAFNTAEYLKVSTNVINIYESAPIATINKYIKQLRIISGNYLDFPTDTMYWQINKIKSVLMVLYTESALLLKTNPTLAGRLLCVSNYWTRISGCNEFTEGLAEVLQLINNQNDKSLIMEVMSAYELSSNSKIYSIIRKVDFHELHDHFILHSIPSSSVELYNLRSMYKIL